MRKRKFFVHYNKPRSQQEGKMIMSVHHADVCHLVEKVQIMVPIWSKSRKQQPRCVMEGYCTKVEVQDGVAIVS